MKNNQTFPAKSVESEDIFPAKSAEAAEQQQTIWYILDATWRDGAQLASPAYLNGPDGEALPVMRVDEACQAIHSQLLDLIGHNEPVDYFNADPDRSIRPEARNKIRDELRERLEQWSQDGSAKV